jgi:ArsR family transcriptional regulator
MTEENSQRLARQLWALGDEVRLRLLGLLPTSAGASHEYNVSRLAQELGLSQPTVSHHLRVLRQAGLVTHKKMCRDCYYWIEREAAGDVLGALATVLAEPPEQPAASELAQPLPKGE